MSLFGKIMAVLNVLMAAVFVYLAVLDKNVREKWSHAALRHDLVIEGLPADEQETDNNDRPKAAKLSDGTLKDVFQPAPTNRPPTRTQVEEINKLQEALEAKITNPGEKQTATQVLARILLPLARTTDRREGLLKLAAGQDLAPDELKATFDSDFADEVQKLKPEQKDERRQLISQRLQAEFKRAFEEVLGKTSPGTKTDLANRKKAHAQMLLQLLEFLKEDETLPDPARNTPLDTKAYRRALIVLGLALAVEELNVQAHTLQKWTQEMDRAMSRDREAFVAEHRLWLEILAAFAEEVDRQKHTLNIEKNKTAQLAEEVKTREKNVKEVQDELDKAQDETKAKLRAQTQREQAIFAKQQELHMAREEISKLEREIHVLETALQKEKGR